MATESIGKIVHMDNEFADRFIAAQERAKTNPQKQREFKIEWADSKKITETLKKQYGHEE
ncbi:MAG: hypothetical protein LBT26_04775 [Clostridiales Family XIII bacterium]|nr:hypothetical protein [Clostridiales Family XIII bacterium]